MAIDDVFHWGGDFADVFIYDIYPYTMFDYRYGNSGNCRSRGSASCTTDLPIAERDGHFQQGPGVLGRHVLTRRGSRIS